MSWAPAYKLTLALWKGDKTSAWYHVYFYVYNIIYILLWFYTQFISFWCFFFSLILFNSCRRTFLSCIICIVLNFPTLIELYIPTYSFYISTPSQKKNARQLWNSKLWIHRRQQTMEHSQVIYTTAWVSISRVWILCFWSWKFAFETFENVMN